MERQLQPWGLLALWQVLVGPCLPVHRGAGTLVAAAIFGSTLTLVALPTVAPSGGIVSAKHEQMTAIQHIVHDIFH